jgi:capping protein beta
MIEDMENKIRNTLNEIYFGKTKDVVNGLRSVEVLADQKQKLAMAKDLVTVLSKRNAKTE